jgi:hypothetical protein
VGIALGHDTAGNVAEQDRSAPKNESLFLSS